MPASAALLIMPRISDAPGGSGATLIYGPGGWVLNLVALN